jgi:hypothetical protein
MSESHWVIARSPTIFLLPFQTVYRKLSPGQIEIEVMGNSRTRFRRPNGFDELHLVLVLKKTRLGTRCKMPLPRFLVVEVTSPGNEDSGQLQTRLINKRPIRSDRHS